MFSFSKANHIISNGGKVDGSAITNSTIDMNGGIITSHIMPLVPLDVANKQYVDLVASTIETVFDITLIGTNYTTISNDLIGQMVISIRNIVDGGPCGVFFLSKNSSAIYPSYTRVSSVAGVITKERLEMSWDPGTGLSVKKNGINYDGEYRVKLAKN
jgi:hypothetical protein